VAVPDRIGKYTVIKELGSGGFGTVYLAQDPKLKLRVAIKVFKVRGLASAGATLASTESAEVLRERFLTEARLLRQLSSNPHIVDMHEFDEMADGTPYFVMPYLKSTLIDEMGKDVLSSKELAELPRALHPRKVALSKGLHILMQLLQGLGVVHCAGLVHRDLKPANVLFGEQGIVQIGDFGVAKTPDSRYSESGITMGSRNYMSPEQRGSAKYVDTRSDVYSVGVLAYRMFTGTLPIGRFDDPINYCPELGDALNTLIVEALETDPDSRPTDASVFLDRLNKAIKQLEKDIPEASEHSRTEVGAAPEMIRDELKTIEKKIETVLLEDTEINTDAYKQLQMMASIVDLNEAALNALINNVEKRLASQIKSERNFLRLIDAELAQNKSLNSEAIDTLLEIGQQSGISLKRLNRLIAKRQSESVPLINEQPSPAKKSFSLYVMTLLMIAIVLMGYGAWQYNDYQSQQQIHLAQQVELSRTRQLAAEKSKLVQKIQQELKRLGYSISSVDGIVTIYTANAIKQFEHDTKQSVTGKVSENLLAVLQQTIDKPIDLPDMITIPSGSFLMGSSRGDIDERPIHSVSIDAFEMGKTEVTKGQFEVFSAITGYRTDAEKNTDGKPGCYINEGLWRWAAGTSWRNPGFNQDNNEPVVCVSWNDAQAYIEWLNNTTSLHYRLPTESEWEYAARAGSSGRYSWGDNVGNNRANCKECGSNVGSVKTTAVGHFESNSLGLFDMHGNVYEWLKDCYVGNYSNTPANGDAKLSDDCGARVLRGGSWLYGADYLRSANRSRLRASHRYFNIGFRIVRERINNDSEITVSALK